MGRIKRSTSNDDLIKSTLTKMLQEREKAINKEDEFSEPEWSTEDWIAAVPEPLPFVPRLDQIDWNPKPKIVLNQTKTNNLYRLHEAVKNNIVPILIQLMEQYDYVSIRAGDENTGAFNIDVNELKRV